ncbi:MAG: hypothetical protein ACE5JV_01225 [Nitrososphaerales archaeon]
MTIASLLGKKTLMVWTALVVIVGAGSLAIATSGGAVHQEDIPDIQRVSNELIHLDFVDGKINTNVPVAGSRAFSPSPLEFAQDEDPVTNADATGSTIATGQKIAMNFVVDAATVKVATFRLDNASEDSQIFLIRANATSNVIIDMQSVTNNITIHGLVGHNEWLASIPPSDSQAFQMELFFTDAGFYPIVVEMQRIG